MSVLSEPRPILARQDSKVNGVDSRFCCNICLEAVVDPVATLCGHLYCWPCLFRWLEPGMYPGERASLGIMQQSLASDANRRVCPVCKAPCSVPTLVPIYVRESHESETSSGSRNKTITGEQGDGESGNEDEKKDDEETNDLVGTTDDVFSELEVNESSSGLSDTAHGISENISGLRQRIRFRSRDSDNSMDTVPSRPPANSPQHQSPASPSSTPLTPQRYGMNSWVAPLTPTGHRGSLTHGILLSIQQATAGSAGVPPLHRREGLHPTNLDADASASEYLSRLLLMLGCFVILCLLLL